MVFLGGGGGGCFATVSYTLTGPGLELTEIYLPLPPEYWAYGRVLRTTPHQARNRYNLIFFFEVWFLCVALACPGIHSVDQANLKLRAPPASALRVPGLKACAMVPTPGSLFFGFFLIK